MADYTEIDPNTLLPGEPWTSAKALAAFANPEAIAEGATGAPRIELMAIERLTAGDNVRSQRSGVSVATDPVAYITVHQAGFMQIGTIRARVQSGSGLSRNLRVIRRRAGADTVVAGPISNTILVADINVIPGDGLFVQVEGIVSDTTTWQGDFLTGGENLWPAPIVNVVGNVY